MQARRVTMEVALTVCVKMGLRIFDMAQTAKANKHQAKLLAERVKRLMEQVQRMARKSEIVCPV